MTGTGRARANQALAEFRAQLTSVSDPDVPLPWWWWVSALGMVVFLTIATIVRFATGDDGAWRAAATGAWIGFLVALTPLAREWQRFQRHRAGRG